MLEGAEVRLAVDIGGTFTDIVLDVGRDRKTRKVLTTPARSKHKFTKRSWSAALRQWSLGYRKY